jgi:hypothetical protein
MLFRQSWRDGLMRLLGCLDLGFLLGGNYVFGEGIAGGWGWGVLGNGDLYVM